MGTVRRYVCHGKFEFSMDGVDRINPAIKELPGPIYLQGSEKGRVAYRSIILTPAEK